MAASAPVTASETIQSWAMPRNKKSRSIQAPTQKQLATSRTIANRRSFDDRRIGNGNDEPSSDANNGPLFGWRTSPVVGYRMLALAAVSLTKSGSYTIHLCTAPISHAGSKLLAAERIDGIDTAARR